MLRTAVLESPELPGKNDFSFGGMGGRLPGLLIFYFNFYIFCVFVFIRVCAMVLVEAREQHMGASSSSPSLSCGSGDQRKVISLDCRHL